MNYDYTDVCENLIISNSDTTGNRKFLISNDVGLVISMNVMQDNDLKTNSPTVS